MLKIEVIPVDSEVPIIDMKHGTVFCHVGYRDVIFVKGKKPKNEKVSCFQLSGPDKFSFGVWGVQSTLDTGTILGFLSITGTG